MARAAEGLDHARDVGGHLEPLEDICVVRGEELAERSGRGGCHLQYTNDSRISLRQFNIA
jgi:hypothetical protein